jgi:hypothetical protein
MKADLPPAPEFVIIRANRGVGGYSKPFRVARRDMEKIQEIFAHAILIHTCEASFEMKPEVWIST